MDVNKLQKSENNKDANVPKDFYNIVSKILTFVDEIDRTKDNQQNLNLKKKGDKNDY